MLYPRLCNMIPSPFQCVPLDGNLEKTPWSRTWKPAKTISTRPTKHGGIGRIKLAAVTGIATLVDYLLLKKLPLVWWSATRWFHLRAHSLHISCSDSDTWGGTSIVTSAEWLSGDTPHWPNSQIPECTCSISHNAPFRTEMCTFLFWMGHCGIWNKCILGFVKLVSCTKGVAVIVQKASFANIPTNDWVFSCVSASAVMYNYNGKIKSCSHTTTLLG